MEKITNSHTVPNFIFVGGAPRSGTTLLQNMLDSHPDIIGGPEFLHLPDIIGLRKVMQPDFKRGWLDEYCTKDEADTYIKQLIENFLLPISKNNNVSFISEKTPANITVFTELAELYPEAYFIQIVRDPRAVAASMLKVGRRGTIKGMRTQPFTRKISHAADYLRMCYAKGLEFQSLHQKRILTIRYEDLVTRAEDLTRQICAFLGLAWDERMLRPEKQEHSGEKAISNDVWYKKEEYKRPPTDAEIEKWRNNLSLVQKAVILYRFRGYHPLTVNGYQLDKEFKAPLVGHFYYAVGWMGYTCQKLQEKFKNRFINPVKKIIFR